MVFALLTVWLALPARGVPAAAPVSVGDEAPALVLRTAEGSEFRLRDELRDHPVLLAFVSPRCKPCEDSRPALEELSRTYGSADKLALVSVLFGGDVGVSASEAPAIGAQTLVQGTDATAEAYGVFGTPVFLLVGRQGKVIWKHVGRLAPGAVDCAVREALANMLARAR